MLAVNLCRCGCGAEIPIGRVYVNGHQRKGKPCSPEHRRKLALSHIGRPLSAEHRKRLGDGLRGEKFTKEHRERIAQSLRGRKRGRISDEARARIRKQRKEMWKDPDFHRKQQGNMARGLRFSRPNKKETALFEIMESVQPGEWRYVGDGALIIDGKNPDFVNVNGKKLLIELFGDYWHKGQRPSDRAKIFKPFGFRTLVIWERELVNVKRLKRRILKFST